MDSKLLDLSLSDCNSTETEDGSCETNLMDMSLSKLHRIFTSPSGGNNFSFIHSEHRVSSLDETLGILHESMLVESPFSTQTACHPRMLGTRVPRELENSLFGILPGTDPDEMRAHVSQHFQKLIFRLKADSQVLRTPVTRLNRSASVNDVSTNCQSITKSTKLHKSAIYSNINVSKYKTRLDFSEVNNSLDDSIMRTDSIHSFALSRRKSSSFASLSMCKEGEDLTSVQIDLEDSLPSEDEWGLPKLKQYSRASRSPAVDRTVLDSIKNTLHSFRLSLNSPIQDTLGEGQDAPSTSDSDLNSEKVQKLNLTFEVNESDSKQPSPGDMLDGRCSPSIPDSLLPKSCEKLPARTSKSPICVKKDLNSTFLIENEKENTFLVEPKNLTFDANPTNLSAPAANNLTFELEPKNLTYEVGPKDSTVISEVRTGDLTYLLDKAQLSNPDNCSNNKTPKSSSSSDYKCVSVGSSNRRSVGSTKKDVMNRYQNLRSSSESQINCLVEPSTKMIQQLKMLPGDVKNSYDFVLMKKKKKERPTSPVRAIVPVKEVAKNQSFEGDILSQSPSCSKPLLHKSLSSSSLASSFDSFIENQPPLSMSTPDNKTDKKFLASESQQANVDKENINPSEPVDSSILQKKCTLIPQKTVIPRASLNKIKPPTPYAQHSIPRIESKKYIDPKLARQSTSTISTSSNKIKPPTSYAQLSKPRIENKKYIDPKLGRQSTSTTSKLTTSKPVDVGTRKASALKNSTLTTSSNMRNSIYKKK